MGLKGMKRVSGDYVLWEAEETEWDSTVNRGEKVLKDVSPGMSRWLSG